MMMRMPESVCGVSLPIVTKPLNCAPLATTEAESEPVTRTSGVFVAGGEGLAVPVAGRPWSGETLVCAGRLVAARKRKARSVTRMIDTEAQNLASLRGGRQQDSFASQVARAEGLEEAVFFAFFEERCAADAEDFGSLGHFVARGFECGGDYFAFGFGESAQRAERAARSARGVKDFREALRREGRIVREDERVLDRVLEFADVAGPGVSIEQPQRGRIE